MAVALAVVVAVAVAVAVALALVVALPLAFMIMVNGVRSGMRFLRLNLVLVPFGTERHFRGSDRSATATADCGGATHGGVGVRRSSSGATRPTCSNCWGAWIRCCPREGALAFGGSRRPFV